MSGETTQNIIVKLLGSIALISLFILSPGVPADAGKKKNDSSHTIDELQPARNETSESGLPKKEHKKRQNNGHSGVTVQQEVSSEFYGTTIADNDNTISNQGNNGGVHISTDEQGRQDNGKDGKDNVNGNVNEDDEESDDDDDDEGHDSDSHGIIKKLEKRKQETTHPKVSNALVAMEEIYTKRGLKAVTKIAEQNGIIIKDGAIITVRLILKSEIGAEQIDQAKVEGFGGKIITRTNNVLKVDIPLNHIRDLADSIDEIQHIDFPPKPRPLSFQTEGAHLSGAAAYHSAGIKGAGVKVGVIDVGFMGINAAIANGDLPSNVLSVDCTSSICSVAADFSTDSEVHGTAVAEIIYDMAPSVQLYLIKVDSEDSLTLAKDFCVQNAINIINHSVGWNNTNFYDGRCYYNNPVCTVDDAKLRQIFWVNAMGNEAQRHYGAFFTETSAEPYKHIDTISLYADVGSWINLYLTWDDWPMTAQDYDMYLVHYNPFCSLDANGSWVGCYEIKPNQQGGQDNQTGTEPPIESITWQVSDAGTYEIWIFRSSNASSMDFTLYSLNHKISPAIPSRSLVNPADARGAFAVAAVPIATWTTGQPASFYSSQGPANDGWPKPEISGPTDVSTNSYGTLPFNGTSAASPHVAGAAALILSADPSYSVSQLWNVLTSAAIPMGYPYVYGAGRLRLPNIYALQIYLSGSGGGTVVSSADMNDGISCPYDCDEEYYLNTKVTLTAEPDQNSTFIGWSGGDCSGAQSCTVTMNAAKDVTAKFELNKLTLTKNGWGFGTVTSDPAGILCDASCTSATAVYSRSTNTVTLTAIPDENSVFVGWSGNCAGTGDCSVLVRGEKTAMATFDLLPPIAFFTASATLGYTPTFTVRFTDQSQRWVDTRVWDFGDGETSNEPSPLHVYRTVGTYTVTLTVKNHSGTDTWTEVISVMPCPNLPVMTIDSAGGRPKYYASLQDAYNAVSDQTTIKALAVEFIENLNANRAITVSISGGYECQFKEAETSSVLQGKLSATDGTVIIGDFEFVVGPKDNEFDLISIAGQGGSILPSGTSTVNQGVNESFSITPDFGYSIADVLVDGTSIGAVSVYTFENVTTNHTIKALFASTLTRKLIVDKSGSGSGTITSLPTGLNCGSVCSAEYILNGTVTLTALPDANFVFAGWSGGGCSGTGQCTITMNADTTVTATFNIAPPIADFMGSPTTGLETLTVNFTDLSTGSPTSWYWNFGDGTASSLQNPSHTYNSPGNFTVSLIATNAGGSTISFKPGYVSVQSCQNMLVRIAGATPAYYPTLQAAYDAAPEGAIIQSRNLIFTENLTANKNINITLEGGFGCDYSASTGNTSLKGMLTTSAGTVTIKNFILEK